MRSGDDLKGRVGAVIAASLIVSLLVAASRSNADDTSPSAPSATDSTSDAAPGKKVPAPPKLPEPKGAKRLSKDYPIWIDPKERAVIVA